MGVWHVDNAQVAPVLALADGDSRSLVSGTIFKGTGQNILYFRFRDIVTVDMRLAGSRVDVETQFHVRILRRIEYQV